MLYRYDSFSKEAVEYDTAPYYLIPLFKIGEVAKMLNRSVETIRKYENLNYYDKAKQYKISEGTSQSIRLYTEGDIHKLAEFFANRRPVGRPSGLNKTSKINQRELMAQIDARYKQVKRIGN